MCVRICNVSAQRSAQRTSHKPTNPSLIHSHTLCNVVPITPAWLQEGDPPCQHWRSKNELRQPTFPNACATCQNSSEAGYDCNLPASTPQCPAHHSLRWLCLAQCMWLPDCRRPEGAAQLSCLIRCSASQPCSTPDASLLVLTALGAVHVDTGDRLQGSPQGLQLLQRLACVLQQATHSAKAHLYYYQESFASCISHSMYAWCLGIINVCVPPCWLRLSASSASTALSRGLG